LLSIDEGEHNATTSKLEIDARKFRILFIHTRTLRNNGETTG